MNPSYHLNASQIHSLQLQIRQFKSLSKRYSESLIPKTVNAAGIPDTASSNNQEIQADSSKSQSDALNSTQSGVNLALKTATLNQSKNSKPSESVDPVIPPLTWQCCNSLLFCGPPRAPIESCISFPYGEIGSFSKGTHVPLVLTLPFVTSLRERILKQREQLLQTSEDMKLLRMQRQVRTKLIVQYLSGMRGTTESNDRSGNLNALETVNPPIWYGKNNCMSELLPYRNYLRVKKQGKRETKQWEKDEKRRRSSYDVEKRRRQTDFLKKLTDHRDEFQRFHRSKRADCSKIARIIKQQIENLDARKEKDEVKAEFRRLQALRENDMEAYKSLVQDTKNGRLKFLLNETDSYIAAINKMIQQQRDNETDVMPAGSIGQLLPSDSLPIESKSSASSRFQNDPVGGTQTTKDYYRNTHKKTELVLQPTMLKGGDLKEYQLSGLQWLVSLYNNNLNGILADEMGLGKTIQTIALLCYLMEYKRDRGPFLIVVPLSTLSNWVNEFNRWAPDIIKVVYKGMPQTRKQIFRDDVEPGRLNVLLTTYEFIMKDKGSLRKLTWHYIIVDEGHRMKNAQSKFAQILGTIYQSKNRILLTGTPLQNNLPELWALLNFLLPTIFSSVETFDQWFNKPFAAFRNQPAPGAVDPGAVMEGDPAQQVAVLSQEERLLIVHRLHEVLRPFVLRRVKDQVLDQLPDKVEKVVRCNLSGWQRKMYQSIAMKGLLNKDKESLSSNGGLNNIIMQLRKVCNHPFLFIRDYQVDEDLIRCSGKFELLDRMLPKLKRAGHRVLLFSQMVELMNFLEQFFLMRGFTYLRLDGNTNSDEREKRMYMFNDPDSPYFIFLLSTRAGGLGLNLATADTVIIFDSDWNPMMDAQAQDRAHRIGQKNEVRVFRLLTNSPIEERILARATDKKNLTGLVVEAGKFNNSSKSVASSSSSAMQLEADNKEMMESLLKEWSSGGAVGAYDKFKMDGDEEGNGGESDVLDDEQINEMMAIADSEYQLYQRMDSERNQERERRWREMYQHRTGGSSGQPPPSVMPPLPPRLMLASERPLWLTESCWPTKYNPIMVDMMNYNVSGSGGKSGRSDASKDGEMMDGETSGTLVGGKTMRKRKEIQYDDGLTERQFSNYIDRYQDHPSGGDGEVAGSHLKPQIMKLGGFTTINNNSGDEENPTMKLSLKVSKTKLNAAMAQENAEKGIFKDLVKVVKDLHKLTVDERLVFELFIERPPRVIYPDYYSIIEEPIALKDVLLKLRKLSYHFLEEIETDFAKMSNNARVYNLDSSPVFQDCETMRQEFFQQCVKLREKYSMPPPPPYTVLPVDDHEDAEGGGGGGVRSMPKLPVKGHQIYQETPHSFTGNLFNTVPPKPTHRGGKKRQVLTGSPNEEYRPVADLDDFSFHFKTSSKSTGRSGSDQHHDNPFHDEDDEMVVMESYQETFATPPKTKKRTKSNKETKSKRSKKLDEAVVNQLLDEEAIQSMPLPQERDLVNRSQAIVEGEGEGEAAIPRIRGSWTTIDPSEEREEGEVREDPTESGLNPSTSSSNDLMATERRFTISFNSKKPNITTSSSNKPKYNGDRSSIK